MKKTLSFLLVFLFVLAVFPTGFSGWNVPAMATAPTIVQIAAGYNNSFALLSDGSLYAWGVNWYGKLGDGTRINRNIPVKIGTGFTAIAAGTCHTLALKGNALYAWGYNNDGELGDGTYTSRYTPVQIGTGYTAITAGNHHSLALKGDTLYTWGDNQSGNLGDGTNINRNTPVQIGTGYTTITAGVHSLALKGNTLYTWGYNYHGQLGDGTNTNKNTPVQIGAGYTAITAGLHTLALKGDILYAWGYNFSNELGDGTNTNKNTPVQIGSGYTAIAAGEDHSLALKGDTLYTWGRNMHGQLGNGTSSYSPNRNPPMQIGTGYTAIAAGDDHSLALKGNILYAWGYNEYGQLGDGTNTDRYTPTRITFFGDLLNPTPDTSGNKLRFGKDEYSMAIGDSIPISVWFYKNGKSLSSWAISESNKITWSISDSSVATVISQTDSILGYTAIIKGLKNGTCTISAKATELNTGEMYTGSAVIKVGTGGTTPTPKPTPTSTLKPTPTPTLKPTPIPTPKPTSLPVDPDTDVTNTDYSIFSNESINKRQTFKSITINNNAKLTITKNGNVTVDKNLTVKKGGTLIVKGKVYVAGSLTLENGASLQMVVEDNKITPNISVKGTMVVNSENIAIGKGTIEANSLKASDTARKSILVQMKQTTADSIITVSKLSGNDNNKDKEKMRVIRVNEAIQSKIFYGVSVHKKIPAKFEFGGGKILRDNKTYGYQIKIIEQISVSLTGKSAAFILVEYTEGDITCKYQCIKIGGESIDSFLNDVQTELKDYAYEVAMEKFIDIIFAKNNVVFMCGALPSKMTEIVLSSKEVYDLVKSSTKEVLTVKKLIGIIK